MCHHTDTELSLQENHHVDNITAKMKSLRGKVAELERAAAQRKAKLDENSAFLQFNWKADVVESWIGMQLHHGCVCKTMHFLHQVYNLGLFRHCSGEKETSLKTDDYGRDLSSVQTLLTKQVWRH